MSKQLLKTTDCFRSPCVSLIVAVWAMTVWAGSSSAAEARTGEQVYQALCADCHGPKGVGTDNYKEPLLGDLSISELTRIIDKTMPEGEPEACTGEEAQNVATYIHESFYSPMAQFRNQPPRRELTRLTVRQQQQIMSDLIGSFRRQDKLTDERGLKGTYYKKRRFGERAFERTDAVVKFDFGHDSPDEKQMQGDEFSIRWEGALLAPETADYEFIVSSPQAVRLWINDMDQPLVDAYVQSGDNTEHSGTVRLTAGRAYPLKLEFSKATQGVGDAKNQEAKKLASVKLLWKLPQRVAEVVPARCLLPQRPSEVFVLHTKFPADDRTLGYERGTFVTPEWERAAMEAALETADYIASHRKEFAGVPLDAKDHRERLQKFCTQFAERAFCRPLSAEERDLYVDRHFAESIDDERALKRSLLLTLQSPRFLYVDLDGLNTDPYDVAARIALSLWDSLPDETLRKAAAEDKLKTAADVRTQAARMLNDQRTKAKVHEFFLQWLKVDQVPDLAKNAESYTGFSPEVACDLRTSLELFIDGIVWSEKSDFRQLLQSQKVPLNGPLAKFYGADLPSDAGFQEVTTGAAPRAGVLTHPYLMSSFAYTDSSSPIHRGVFISRALLGRALKSPPIAVAPTAPHLAPDLTTRQRVAEQTKAEACIACHGMINPLGFSLEAFDAVGRFRQEEHGHPIDSHGKYITREGKEVEFNGSRELADFLAGNDETHDAFVDQFFHYLIKQPIRAYDGASVAALRKSFRDNDFNIGKLTVEIVTTAALPPADQADKPDLSLAK